MDYLEYVFPLHRSVRILTEFDMQDKQLYVYDPKAMHHIIVKDQDIYEETSLFISCVEPLNMARALACSISPKYR